MSVFVRNERAETTIQTVVLVPIVFLIVFMCFHLGSTFHQSHIAQLAASRGASVASGLAQTDSSVLQARREIERVVSDLGSRLATQPVISYRDRGVEVRVTLTSSTAVSFLPATASADVWRPMESFRQEHDRR